MLDPRPTSQPLIACDHPGPGGLPANVTLLNEEGLAVLPMNREAAVCAVLLAERDRWVKGLGLGC